MGFFEAAKNFVTDPENIAKVKALATDKNVDLAAGKLRELAPEQVRGAVDGLAEKAKEWGGPEDEEPAAKADEKQDEPVAPEDEKQEDEPARPAESSGEEPAGQAEGGAEPAHQAEGERRG